MKSEMDEDCWRRARFVDFERWCACEADQYTVTAIVVKRARKVGWRMNTRGTPGQAP